jgi:PleD family two-component response regulator
VFAEWMQSVEQEREFQMGFRVLHRDGTVLHVRSQAKALRDGTGAITGFLGFAQDVTTEVALQAELQYQASHDALTRLLNRRHLPMFLPASRWRAAWQWHIN